MIRGPTLPVTLLDKNESRIRAMFAEIAPCYDLLNRLLSLRIDQSWRKRVTALVPCLTGGPILDLCSGTGDLALAYDKACGGQVPIVASDFCSEMLQLAAPKVAKRNASERIQLIEADAQRLPFADNTFEIAAVAFGLRNVMDPEMGIDEMVRVVRPGGRVAILEFSKPQHWFFGRMYRLYFRFLLPLVGQMFSRSRQSAYKYLPESVHEFINGEAQAEQLRRHGLVEVWFRAFTLGVATLYVGTKPLKPEPPHPSPCYDVKGQ